MVATQDPGGAEAGTTSAPPASTSDLADTWQGELLKALGAPITNTGVAALTYWDNSEGTLWANNPLAASGGSAAQGATNCIAQCGSSSPIMQFATMADGVAYDAAFLQHNNYTNVVGAFLTQGDNKDGSINTASLAFIWNAINKSGWCSGCQGGEYPEALHAALNLTSAQISADVNKITGGKVGLGAVAGAIKSTLGAAGQAAAQNATSWTSLIPTLGNLLTDFTNKTFWIRIGLGALGAILLLVGIWLIVGQTKTGQTIQSTAVKAGEVAAVV